mmetsp:Transcript_126945/g.179097  ORF Transcript_126945/g.179097 Transcript_126945/m.179097 type:complete len:159 (+) Transcript_126945:61-537(+)
MSSMSHRTADERVAKPFSRQGLVSWLRRWTRQTSTTTKPVQGNDTGSSGLVSRIRHSAKQAPTKSGTGSNSGLSRKQAKPAQNQSGRRKPKIADYFQSIDIQSEASSTASLPSTACSSTMTRSVSEDETYELSPVAKAAAKPRRAASASESCCMPFLI